MLDLAVDLGTDFAAWKSQWKEYSSLQAWDKEDEDKQAKALIPCFSRESLTSIQNLGLSPEYRKQIKMAMSQSSTGTFDAAPKNPVNPSTISWLPYVSLRRPIASALTNAQTRTLETK